MPDDPDQLVLSQPDQFRALGHPLRHRLLLALRQRPATFAQLAAALRSPKGTVSYHIKVLERAGLVQVAHTRHVRGGTEQYYEPSSRHLRVAPEAPVGGDFLVKAALAEMAPAQPGAPDLTVLRHLRLTTKRARALAARLERFATDTDLSDQADGQPYGILLSLYRADIPVLPPEQDGRSAT